MFLVLVGLAAYVPSGLKVLATMIYLVVIWLMVIALLKAVLT